MNKNQTVAPVPQPGQAPLPTPEQLLIHSERAGVWIPLMQNLAGGLIGAGGVVTLISYYTLNAPLPTAATDGFIVGMFVFCAATAVRMFRDEFRFVLNAFGEKQDRLTRDALSKELQEQRALVKQLQAQGAVSNAMVALLTARKLIFWAYSQKQNIDRDSCVARGMTRPTWEAGNKVLRAAHVVDGRSRLLLSTEIEAWAAVMKSQDGGMGHYDVTPTGDIVKTAQ